MPGLGWWEEQMRRQNTPPAPATQARRITVDGVEATTAGESSWAAPPGYSRVSADAITRAREAQLNRQDPTETAAWDARADARLAAWESSPFYEGFTALFSRR